MEMVSQRYYSRVDEVVVLKDVSFDFRISFDFYCDLDKLCSIFVCLFFLFIKDDVKSIYFVYFRLGYLFKKK